MEEELRKQARAHGARCTYHMTRKIGSIKVVDIVIVSDRNASLSLIGTGRVATCNASLRRVCKVAGAVCVACACGVG